MPFRFHYGDQTWELDDLTGEELEALEATLQCRYIDLEPGLKARDTLAILATFLSRKLDEERVAKAIKKLTLRQIRDDIWSFSADDSMPTEFLDGIPKAAGGRGTSTSSSSRVRRSTGRPTSPDGSPSET